MKSISIKDVAKIAGVGTSTVSRVLNNHPDVNADTKKKILKVMAEINYIPNNSARNLKRINSKNIGVLVKGIYNPFFSKIIKYIEERIDKEGYTMILHYNDSYSSDIEVAMELIKEKKLRGLICVGGDFDDFFNNPSINVGIPLVLISTHIVKKADKTRFSSVTIENDKAAFEAVDYLFKLGHKKIGIIAGNKEDRSIGKLRIKGYKDALEKNGIKYEPDFLERGDYTFKSGFCAMDKLLDKNLGITAVFVTSDIMAIGASKAILVKGFKIPDDISVIGFDGLEYSKYFHPSITTVKQPDKSMGEKCVEILFDIIKNKKRHRHVVLNTELVKRKSCKQII